MQNRKEYRYYRLIVTLQYALLTFRIGSKWKYPTKEYPNERSAKEQIKKTRSRVKKQFRMNDMNV